MRWRGRRESGNVEDRRSRGRAGLAIGGGGAIVVVILALLMGVDPMALLQQGGVGIQQPVQQPPGPEDEEAVRFVKVVLADTEDVWGDLFRRQGLVYHQPKLVLFRGQVQSACGSADSAVGPFYCPADQQVYIDLSFFQELKQKFGAPGDFAQAYVIAHEIGHHVQQQLGISDRVHQQQQRLSERDANRLSVRLELQADFLAGVWAHHVQKTKQVLDPGDLEEALRAAGAIGDDRLQKQGRGYVVPDSFTHGTSEQRLRWFRAGIESGDFSRRDELFDREYDQL